MESEIKHLEMRLSGAAKQGYTMLYGKSQLILYLEAVRIYPCMDERKGVG